MIKERIKKLSCFLIIFSMLFTYRVPVFAVVYHETLHTGDTFYSNINELYSNNMYYYFTDLDGKSHKIKYNDFEDYKTDPVKKQLINTLYWYKYNATSDENFASNFSTRYIDGRLCLAFNAYKYALDNDITSNIEFTNSMYNLGVVDGHELQLDKYKNSFTLCNRGYVYLNVDSSLLTSFIDFSTYTSDGSLPDDVFFEIVNNSSGYCTFKFISSTYDMEFTVMSIDKFIEENNKVYAVWNADTFHLISEPSSPDYAYTTQGIKVGDTFSKGTQYMISKFEYKDSDGTTKTLDFADNENMSNLAIVDDETNEVIDLSDVKFSNSVSFVNSFTPKRTYKVVDTYIDSDSDSFADKYYYNVAQDGYHYNYEDNIAVIKVHHTHVPVKDETVLAEPTCTGKGSSRVTIKCSDCSEQLKEEVVATDALGHNPGIPAKEEETIADCTHGGSYNLVTRCTRCNEILNTELKTTPANGHQFEGWVDVTGVSEDLIQNALNSDDFDTLPSKVQSNTCSVCGAYKLRLVDGHKHSNYITEKQNEVKATCASEGSYDLVTKCGVCGEVITTNTVVVNKAPHTVGSPKIENVVEATCENSGSYDEVVRCTVCNTELSRSSRTTKALGHISGVAVKENIVNPTCTEPGSYDEVVRCTREDNGCNHKVLSTNHVVVLATGHLHQETRIDKVKEPTCTAKGLYNAITYCIDCNTDLTTTPIDIPATGHKPSEVTKENEKNATCTEKGSYDEVIKCKTCGVDLSRNTVETPALGHAYGNPVVKNKVEPTTSADGGYDLVFYCTRCNVELNRTHIKINKLQTQEHAHTVDSPVIENKIEPTCEAEGSFDINVYCTDCGTLLSSSHEKLPALGHNYELTNTVKPTCESDGYNDYVCKNDASHTKHEVIKSLGHNYIHCTDSLTNPTCTVDGIYRQFDICLNCNGVANEKWVTISALGHSFDTKEEVTASKDLFDSALNKDELDYNKLTKYDKVYKVKCSRCDVYKIIVEKHQHLNFYTEKENIVDATCTHEGSYDEVIKCGICKEEISRLNIIVPKLNHVADDPVSTVVKKANCTEEGVVNYKVHCKNCGTLLLDNEYNTPCLGHLEGTPVIENKTETGYDEVIYCQRCNIELSRKHIKLETPKDKPDVPKVDPTVPEDKPELPKNEPELPKVNPTVPKNESKAPKANTEVITVDTPKASVTVSTDTPKAPRTGDDSNSYIYIMLLSGIALLFCYKKSK